jgi:hypothetical protein
MRSLLEVVSIIALTTAVLGTPSLARADQHGEHGEDHDRGDRGGGRVAPEPFTIIGLGLGAAGIAGARWASRRKSSRKGG